MVPIFEGESEEGSGGEVATEETKRDEAVLEGTVHKAWDDLSDWEQTKYTIRILREMFGLSDARLRHTYEGDGTPFDTGFIDYKRVAEEEAARKLIKKKRGKKKDEAHVKRTDAGS